MKENYFGGNQTESERYPRVQNSNGAASARKTKYVNLTRENCHRKEYGLGRKRASIQRK